MTHNRLAGLRVVVTRATAQGALLCEAIGLLGGVVVQLPLLEIRDPADGGIGLRKALEGLQPNDWLVVLSPNGAKRVVDYIEPGACNLAVIASGTAAVFGTAGWQIDMLPEVASSEGLLAAFDSPLVTIDRAARVLVAQAEHGRQTLADGLRSRGVHVEVAVAYRNEAPTVDERAVEIASQADVVVFASPSAVERYASLNGCCPSRAVCIGAVTGATAREHGFTVEVAVSPTVEALVDLLGK